MSDNKKEELLSINLSANLDSTIKKYKITATDALGIIGLAINEAVMNAIQAEATKIEIIFNIENYPQSNAFGEEYYVKDILIKDNGVGLNKERTKAFLDVNTTFMAKQGGKGIGRFIYPKLFNEASIKCINKEGEEKQFIKFNYDTTSKKYRLEGKYKEASDFENKETELKLADFKIGDYRYKISKDQKDDFLKRIKDKLVEHFEVVFFYNKNLTIDLKESSKIETISSKDINFKEHKFQYPKVENKGTVSSKTEFFKFYYNIENTTLKTQKAIDGGFLADKRFVKKFKDKPFEINVEIPYKVKIYVESEYLTQWVNEERTDFNIPTEYELGEELYLDLLIDLIEHEINLLFEKENLKLKEFFEKKEKDFKETYPHYATEFDTVKKQLRSKGKGYSIAKIKTYIQNELHRKYDDIVSNNAKSIDDIKYVASMELANYIQMREKHLELLEEKLKNNKKEKIYHELFVPQYKESKEGAELSLRENNIWLLDDKLMSHSYLASENMIKNITQNLEHPQENQKTNPWAQDGSDNRPDIVMFFDKKQKDSPKKAVIIEFKAPETTFKDLNAAGEQASRYAEQLLKAHNFESVYGYVICSLNKDYYDRLAKTRSKVFSNEGFILYEQLNISNNQNASIYFPVFIMSYDAILSDAKARNKTFMDILRGNIKIDNKENNNNNK